MGTIPKNAKRVFKGEIFEVWQWEQQMFNGPNQIFEMVKRPNTVQILATVGDQMLIADEEQPHHKRGIGLLGGRVDNNEDPLAAAKRELLEETGMQSNDWELWKTYTPATKLEWTIYFFIARDCKTAQEPKLEAGEKISLQKVNFENFVETFVKDVPWHGQFTCDLLRLKLAGQLDTLRNKLFPYS